MTVAALFVEPKGPYSEVEGVDLWDEKRDARKYAGPHPVVAHPPCARWGRYWYGGPSKQGDRLKLGDDDGCFASAIENVRRWGGVLEHPEASHAWRAFGLMTPPRPGGWVSAGLTDPGWTCCVEQGHFGHRARKATWLYAVDCDLPALPWGRASGEFARLDDGFHTAEERAANCFPGRSVKPRLTKYERLATPKAFRDVLLSMARSACS